MEENMKGKKLAPVNKEFEKEKIELIQLRIRNKFYDRSEVLEQVVSAIIKSDISKNDTDTLPWYRGVDRHYSGLSKIRKYLLSAHVLRL